MMRQISRATSGASPSVFALEFEKLRGAQSMSEIGVAADGAWSTGVIEPSRDAVRTQGEKLGWRGPTHFLAPCVL